MYISRRLENTILEASQKISVLMVCGQRQIGKSTMLYHIKEENRRYVTLDDRNALRLAKDDPSLFFETYGSPLLIDEFQRAPNILLEIKRIVDNKNLKGENSNGMFWLTGSQKFVMMKNISESLAGRVAIFDMAGLSQEEIENRQVPRFSPKIEDLKIRMKSAKNKNIHQLFENIFLGEMPKIRASGVDRNHYYMDYINTYLERDIHELEQVGKLHQFYNFLVYIASRTAQELKYESIARDIGISSPTIKNWISILERSGIISILRPYSSNITNRLVKTPKLYFMDTGLAAYLCRWSSSEVLENGAMDGAFFETFVVSEIIKSYYNSGEALNLYYYRDIDGKEIDLLIVQDDTIYPIEIIKAKDPQNPDKNFSVLEKLKMRIAPGLVICMTDELIPYNRNVWLCPVSVL